jgi:hypothetical protein
MTSATRKEPQEWSSATRTREAALAAARQLLAGTAEAVTPGMAPEDLLTCLTQYRAHLAAVVAATSLPAPLARTLEDTAAAPGPDRAGHGARITSTA